MSCGPPAGWAAAQAISPSSPTANELLATRRRRSNWPGRNRRPSWTTEARIELATVVAGARADLGQIEAALAHLEQFGPRQARPAPPPGLRLRGSARPGRSRSGGADLVHSGGQRRRRRGHRRPRAGRGTGGVGGVSCGIEAGPRPATPRAGRADRRRSKPASDSADPGSRIGSAAGNAVPTAHAPFPTVRFPTARFRGPPDADPSGRRSGGCGSGRCGSESADPGSDSRRRPSADPAVRFRSNAVPDSGVTDERVPRMRFPSVPTPTVPVPSGPSTMA